MVSVQGNVQGAASLAIVMKGKGKELALLVVPIVLVPCDITAVEEIAPAEKRVADTELDELAEGQNEGGGNINGERGQRSLPFPPLLRPFGPRMSVS